MTLNLALHIKAMSISFIRVIGQNFDRELAAHLTMERSGCLHAGDLGLDLAHKSNINLLYHA